MVAVRATSHHRLSWNTKWVATTRITTSTTRANSLRGTVTVSAGAVEVSGCGTAGTTSATGAIIQPSSEPVVLEIRSSTSATR